jgi:hypothetical protein
MADSENSRTLPKFLRAREFPDETIVENQSSAINRRNLLPAAARILPILLDEVPLRTVAEPFHIKELWPRWFDRYQRRLAAERESRDLEARLLKETGGRPVIPPFLAGLGRRIHAAIFSFCAGVMPPMPMLGRSLL